jgi:hypothetical protein
MIKVVRYLKKYMKNMHFLPWKVFSKFQNGQKKCPKMKSENTFAKI